MTNKVKQSRSELHGSKKKKWGLGRWFLIIFFLVLLAGAAHAVRILWKINNTVDQVSQNSTEIGKSGTVDVKKIRPKEASIETGDPINILLLGTDDDGRGRDTSKGYVGRSDSMIILSLNPKTRTTKMLSIPRDVYTDIQGHGQDKINHAFAFGGVDLSIDTVQNFLNVPIDYYAVVNMQGLEQLIDAVGGIDVTSPITFTYQESSFVAGETKHVDGWNAMNFARMRYDDPEGETGRQNRQKLVIKALVDKLSNVGAIANYPQLLEVVAKNVQTNLDLKQALNIYQKYSPALQNITAIRFENLEDLMLNEIYYYYAPLSSRLKVANELRLNSGLTPISASQLHDPLGDTGGTTTATVSKTSKLIINQYPTGFTAEELQQVSQTQDNAQNFRQNEYYTPTAPATDYYYEEPVVPQPVQPDPVQPVAPSENTEQPTAPAQPTQPVQPVTPPAQGSGNGQGTQGTGQ